MGQQRRWEERLQEFDFTIKHRLGRKHGNAAIHRQVARGRGPQSVSPVTDSFNGLVEPDSLNRTR